MSLHPPAGAAASFADLGVPSDLIAVLDRQRITTPFEIQVATIPDALAGRDVLGRAPTGSGKTLAFGLPVVSALPKAKPRRPAAMILSPTRELAEQIRRELEPLARERGRTVLAIYGGVGFRDQLEGLRKGTDLIVACPGRLQDLIDQGEVSLDAVELVVVDEADRMADMGFLPAVRQLLDLTSSKRQTVLFSATLGKEVQVLTADYQRDPVTHEVGEIEPDLSLVDHRFVLTEKMIKVPLAARVIEDAGPTVVFCRTRHGVDRVARQLKNAGVKAGWIHGGRSQNQRDAALHAFTTGRVKALVATDVAARGIHVDGVACVIHFDPPEDEKTYVHRSGRTARAGAGGRVVSFINSDQVGDTKKLQRRLALPGDIEDAPSDVEPIQPGARTGGAGGRGKPVQAQHARPKKNRPSRADRPAPAETKTKADPSPEPSSDQERHLDWTPPKKGSKRRRSASAGGDDGGRGGRAGRPKSKRTGKPRPKNKRGGPKTPTSGARAGVSGRNKPKSQRNRRAGSNGPRR